MIPMIDYKELFETLSEQMAGNQKKIKVDSCLEVFFGYSFDGNLRLSFLSSIIPPSIESTSILNVVQGRETQETYWTSFDLLNTELKDAYFSFCENLIDSIIGFEDEALALGVLKRRFLTWKKLFQKTSEKDVSRETLMGLFGELLALKNLIIPKYGVNTAIKAWEGPDQQSKDFTVNDTWYEVKTIGVNTDSIHISSLAQLSSDKTGHLVVICVEAVSQEYNGKASSIFELIKDILSFVSDESIEDLLIRKIQSVGIDISGKETAVRFDVKSITTYAVSDDFPRITEKNVPFTEITEVQYIISKAAISRFSEG